MPIYRFEAQRPGHNHTEVIEVGHVNAAEAIIFLAGEYPGIQIIRLVSEWADNVVEGKA